MRKTVRLSLFAAVVLTLGAPAPAGAWLKFGADASADKGMIRLLVMGSGSYATVDIAERVGKTYEPMRSAAPLELYRPSPPAEPVAYAWFPRITGWRCDRLSRTFVAVAYRPDGGHESGEFTVRTPSCHDRLTVSAPRSAHRGSQIRVVVRDSWGTGGARGRLCHRAPRSERRCRALRIRRGHDEVAFPFRMRRAGRFRLALRAPAQRLRETVAVGVPPDDRVPPPPVVLTTGDSLMQSVDSMLGDRLAGLARIRRDVHVGSGLSKTLPVDWGRLPGRQVARYRPDAAVLFLGNNDAYPLATPAGTTVECCGEVWITEYARRARRVMRTYVRGGRGAVVWLNVPAARDGWRNPANTAVNLAAARAAAGLARVAVLDMAAVFTPGGRYRDFMTVRGKRVRVRESDGIHFSVAGADVAARLAVRELRRLGVL